jgi:hypothetical protein
MPEKRNPSTEAALTGAKRLCYLWCTMIMLILQILAALINLVGGTVRLWQSFTEKKKSHFLISRLQKAPVTACH